MTEPLFIQLLREAHIITVGHARGLRDVQKLSTFTGLPVSKISSWAYILRLEIDPPPPSRFRLPHLSRLTNLPIVT